MKARSQALWLGAAGVLLALAGCAGDTNPVRDVAVATGVGAAPKPAPDFVASSRPAEIDYVRPGLASRPTQSKSAADVRATEAAMERTRAVNESKAAAARRLGSQPGPAAPARPNP